MKTTAILAAILVLSIGAAAAQKPADKPADLSGTWTGTTTVDQAEDAITLVLALKDGAYSGTLTDTLGFCSETPLQNVAFKDGALTFGVPITDGYVRFELKTDGTRLTGAWVASSGGGGDVVLERAAETKK